MNSSAIAGSGGSDTVSGGGLVAIATRIQERARLLVIERQNLQTATDRLAKLQVVHQREQQINNQCRRHLLQCTNARNEVELEIYKIKDEIQKSENAIERMKREKMKWEGQVEEINRESENIVVSTYGPQMVQLELLVKAFEATVQAKKEEIQMRRNRLEAIRKEDENLKNIYEDYQEKAKQVQNEIEAEKKASAGEGDYEQVSSLSRRIRQALDEVSSDRV
jgi:chromosome segregation ATPase